MSAHTFREAMVTLDLEQCDAVRAFAADTPITAIAQALGRDEDATRVLLSEALFWLSRAVRGPRLRARRDAMTPSPNPPRLPFVPFRKSFTGRS